MVLKVSVPWWANTTYPPSNRIVFVYWLALSTPSYFVLHTCVNAIASLPSVESPVGDSKLNTVDFIACLGNKVQDPGLFRPLNPNPSTGDRYGRFAQLAGKSAGTLIAVLMRHLTVKSNCKAPQISRKLRKFEETYVRPNDHSLPTIRGLFT